MDLINIFEMFSHEVHNNLLYLTLYHFAFHTSFEGMKHGMLSLFEKVKRKAKEDPPIPESEKKNLESYQRFIDTLIEKLKQTPPFNPFDSKKFDLHRDISFLPNLVKIIIEEKKEEYKDLNPETCLSLAFSILNLVWDNTPTEDQNSIKQVIDSFRGELQKTFQNTGEILKILRKWEDAYYLPPKLVYESHFKYVENKREEELERLGHYVNLNLELKLAQKGKDKPEEAIRTLRNCLKEKERKNGIIIGKSGSGKTFTFLKLFKELKDENSYIPLFIELYRFNPPVSHLNFQTFLQEYLGIDTTRFHKDKEKYVLFLDGLNESPNPEGAFTEIKASSALGGRIFLSTQREEDFLKGFSAYYMCDLGEEEIIQYLSYCPRLGNKENAQTLYLQLDRVLQEQIKRPIFLFSLSLLYEETGNIPISLGTLLSKFVNFICERRIIRDGIRIGQPLTPAYKTKVLPYIAFSMCKENKKELKERELEKLFEDIYPNASPPYDFDNFKEQVLQRYWLIKQSTTEASFEFTHELFRDYFAAVYMKRMAIDEVIGLVFPNPETNPTFAGVVQLLCGIESEERIKLLIDGILKNDPYLAASCYAMSTTGDLFLFKNIDSAIDINFPNYLYLDRLPLLYIRGLELLREKNASPEYAKYQCELGFAYWKLSEARDKEANLNRAIDAYKEALKVYNSKEFPQQDYDLALTQHNLASAYAYLSDVRDKEVNLNKAIDAYNEALKARTLEQFPQGYAVTQNGLGAVYWMLSKSRDKEANLTKAIDAYNKALKVGTFEKSPQYYASFQHNLGVAYQMLSKVKDKEINLNKAIDAYNEALKVGTFEKFPQDYALFRTDLGNAYQGLSEVKNKEVNLNKAIDAYNEALKARTLEQFPQGYADTQKDLGNAYKRLSEVRDKEANLNKAIDAYNKALRVTRKDARPGNFVEASHGIALVLQKKGDIPAALRVMEEMLPVAEEVWHPELEDYSRFYEELKSSK